MGFSWYDGSWAFVKEATIPSAKLGGSGSLTDVRVLIDITDADIQASAQADGDDILFTDSEGVAKLDHELISYDNVTGAILAWVRIPAVADASQDYQIWLYYGNAGCAAQENPDGVWKDAPSLPATAVYHFETDVLDSSGNSNDGTNDGTVDVAGAVGRARTFDGTNDSIEAASAGFTTIEQSAYFSICASVKPGASALRQQIFYKGNTGEENLCLFIDEVGHVVVMVYQALEYEYYAEGSINVKDGAYHRIVGVRNGSSFKVYVDGVEDTSITSLGASTQLTTENVYIGKRLNNDYYLNADLDELFIIQGSMSANEVLADFNTIDDAAAFVSFGTESSFVSHDLEMPMTVLEEIVVDAELPMSVLEYAADRSMIVNILGGVISDGDMPIIPAPLHALYVDREIPVHIMELLEIDGILPTTILELIEAGFTMPTPTLQEIHSDIEMVIGQSQDRADDSEIPISIEEIIVSTTEMPISVLEYIVVDSEPNVFQAKEIAADEEPVTFVMTDIYEDEIVPIFIEESLAIDSGVPFGVLQGIYADESPVVSIAEHIVSDLALNVSFFQFISVNHEIPIPLLEDLVVSFVMPIGWDQEIRVNNLIPVNTMERLEEDAETVVHVSEDIATDTTYPVFLTEGINTDSVVPIVLLENIVSDEDVPVFIEQILRIDREPVVFIDEELAPTPVSADRRANVYIMAGRTPSLVMPMTVLEYLKFDSTMPISWWDEVKYFVPYGRYELRNWTWNYRLDVFENAVYSRTASLVEEKV